MYNLQQRKDTGIHINVSNLQVPDGQVSLDFLASMNRPVVDNSANISGYTLCFNASNTVKDALANAIPVDTICGSCGETTQKSYYSYYIHSSHNNNVVIIMLLRF